VAPGPGYRPPFPQARLFTPQPRPRFILPPPPPDWYNVMNENIYANRKVDINCIVSIVRGDNQLWHFLQGTRFIYVVRVIDPDRMVQNCFCRILNSKVSSSYRSQVWKREFYTNNTELDPLTIILRVKNY
jgi:hypothetical protein